MRYEICKERKAKYREVPNGPYWCRKCMIRYYRGYKGGYPRLFVDC